MPLNNLLDNFGVESPAFAGVRFLLYASVVPLLGAVSFRLLIAPPLLRAAPTDADMVREIHHRLQRWIAWAIVALAVGTLLRLAAQHAAFFGATGWSMSTMRPLLVQSGWGHGWIVAAASLGVATVGRILIGSERRWGWGILALATLGFVWSLAMSGHPAGAESPKLAMTLDAFHVIGVGGWIGTLVILTLVAVPASLGRAAGAPDSNLAHEQVARLVALFSPLALKFAAIVFVTGAVASWRIMGSLSALFASDYGLVLLRKLIVVSLVVLVGAYNWRRVLPKMGLPVGTIRLQLSAKLELGVAAIVLAITSVLVATAPR